MNSGSLQKRGTAENQVVAYTVNRITNIENKNVISLAAKNIIQGFIKNIDGELVVIDCCAERKINYLGRSEMPINAHVGDFIVFCKDKSQCYIDHEITRQHELELKRLCDSYFG